MNEKTYTQTIELPKEKIFQSIIQLIKQYLAAGGSFLDIFKYNPEDSGVFYDGDNLNQVQES